MNKKKNRLKSDLIAIILLVAIVAGIFGLGYAVGNKQGRIAEYEKHKVAVVHTVSYGETLWDIAEQYKPSHIYILEYLYEIEQTNNISNAEIYPGDEIILYTWEV